MKKALRIPALLLALLLAAGGLTPCVFAREFSPLIKSENIGINTQYVYEYNDPSWLRQLTVKEDMLSTSGIASENTLLPVCDYPYRIDAAGFKKEVASYVESYTLTDGSMKAAYNYLFKQIGAMSIISDPNATDVDKIQWLRDHGIYITEEQEEDPDSLVMISALYAIMKNDFYYVYKGEHLDVPAGTGLEPALMMYLIAFSGQNKTLVSFIEKYFGTSRVGSLEDYIYYTSLMTLYVNGFLSVKDIGKISREEVYRRMAIMTITDYGIAIDADTASTEEIRQKYLAAMIGSQYEITVDPNSFRKAQQNNLIPYYILQRMALEDAKLTISTSKYSYAAAFQLVIKNTHRFDLENEFFSDINTYNVYLKNLRDLIYINPNPIEDYAGNVTIYVNGQKAGNGQYAKVALHPSALKQSVDIVVKYLKGTLNATTYYHLNIFEGTTAAPDSDLTGLVTGLVPTGNTGTNPPVTNESGSTIPYIDATVPYFNNGIPTLPSGVSAILSLNEKGQLVDQYGNIVDDRTYEPLAPGYRYVKNADGTISIMLIEVPDGESTTGQPEESGVQQSTFSKWKSVIVAASCFFLIALILLLILVLRVTKQRKNKTKFDKHLKERKDKERRKRAKAEARKEKKSGKKK